MGTRILVLDKGYVELIEAWGTGNAGKHEEYPVGFDDYEVGIIEAARQSTQGSFRGWDEDEKLLSTLFHHQHNQSTPFEAAGMTIEVEAPIFVFREWHRHRTQSYNEASARYTPLPSSYYRPTRDSIELRLAAIRDKNRNRQAGAAVEKIPSYDEVDEWLRSLDEAYAIAESWYRYSLGVGIPKEIARIIMPVGHYSRMRASANLRNWLAFLTLRLDKKAQLEIREYAQAVATIVRHTFPRTWKLFSGETDGRESNAGSDGLLSETRKSDAG